MTKVISLLGSTGSIGRQTLQVAQELELRVAALTAAKSVDLMEQQVRTFRPRLAVMFEEEAARELRHRLLDVDVEVLSGPEGLLAAATMEEARGDEAQTKKLMAKGKACAELGYTHGKYEGDEMQLPAVFVVSGEGKVLFAHYASAIADLPDYDEMAEFMEK